MKVIFDVKHLYYLPQYLPVYDELTRRGIVCEFVFYHDNMLDNVISEVVKNQGLKASWMSCWLNALAYYQQQSPDWIIFGNEVSDIDDIHLQSKTVLMQHGIGPKACYYDVSQNLTTVRFVEGEHRLNRLLSLFPTGNFIDTGYAKLDPLINKSHNTLSLEALNLERSKPTLLYAPTFYPSSLEYFPEDFPQQFSQYNIIIKPHFFSLTKNKYRKQRKLLECWTRAKNVYLAPVDDYNLVPFMAISDVLISDASSAMFEFAALDKPVIWCDFYKLRWNYRGVFSYRFTRRLDSDIEYFHQFSERAESYQALEEKVANAVAYPDSRSAERLRVTELLAGKVDGRCAERISDYLMAH